MSSTKIALNGKILTKAEVCSLYWVRRIQDEFKHERTASDDEFAGFGSCEKIRKKMKKKKEIKAAQERTFQKKCLRQFLEAHKSRLPENDFTKAGITLNTLDDLRSVGESTPNYQSIPEKTRKYLEMLKRRKLIKVF